MGFIHRYTSKKSILLKKIIANFAFSLYNKKNCGAIPDFFEAHEVTGLLPKPGKFWEKIPKKSGLNPAFS
jgi:hypothetical protein